MRNPESRGTGRCQESRALGEMGAWGGLVSKKCLVLEFSSADGWRRRFPGPWKQFLPCLLETPGAQALQNDQRHRARQLSLFNLLQAGPPYPLLAWRSGGPGPLPGAQGLRHQVACSRPAEHRLTEGTLRTDADKLGGHGAGARLPRALGASRS